MSARRRRGSAASFSLFQSLRGRKRGRESTDLIPAIELSPGLWSTDATAKVFGLDQLLPKSLPSRTRSLSRERERPHRQLRDSTSPKSRSHRGLDSRLDGPDDAQWRNKSTSRPKADNKSAVVAAKVPLLSPLIQHGLKQHRKKRVRDSDDYLTVKYPNPMTGVVSPSIVTDSGGNTEEDEPAVVNRSAMARKVSARWKRSDDAWYTVDPTLLSPIIQSTNPTPRASISVERPHDDDRFVVNMPSAREPCPFKHPGKTASEVEAIERAERAGKITSRNTSMARTTRIKQNVTAASDKEKGFGKVSTNLAQMSPRSTIGGAVKRQETMSFGKTDSIEPSKSPLIPGNGRNIRRKPVGSGSEPAGSLDTVIFKPQATFDASSGPSSSSPASAVGALPSHNRSRAFASNAQHFPSIDSFLDVPPRDSQTLPLSHHPLNSKPVANSAIGMRTMSGEQPLYQGQVKMKNRPQSQRQDAQISVPTQSQTLTLENQENSAQSLQNRPQREMLLNQKLQSAQPRSTIITTTIPTSTTPSVAHMMSRSDALVPNGENVSPIQNPRSAQQGVGSSPPSVYQNPHNNALRIFHDPPLISKSSPSPLPLPLCLTSGHAPAPTQPLRQVQDTTHTFTSTSATRPTSQETQYRHRTVYTNDTEAMDFAATKGQSRQPIDTADDPPASETSEVERRAAAAAAVAVSVPPTLCSVNPAAEHARSYIEQRYGHLLAHGAAATAAVRAVPPIASAPTPRRQTTIADIMLYLYGHALVMITHLLMVIDPGSAVNRSWLIRRRGRNYTISTPSGKQAMATSPQIASGTPGGTGLGALFIAWFWAGVYIALIMSVLAVLRGVCMSLYECMAVGARFVGWWMRIWRAVMGR